MFTPCGGDTTSTDFLHFVSTLTGQLVILLTALLSWHTSRKNRRDIKEVKRALNGKAEDSVE